LFRRDDTELGDKSLFVRQNKRERNTPSAFEYVEIEDNGFGRQLTVMDSLERELQKMYDSEINVDIGWIWDGGIDVSIGREEAVTGKVKTVAELLPWLQTAISQRYPGSKYNVERMGGEFNDVWVDPMERG
jgi:hypothetical protein